MKLYVVSAAGTYDFPHLEVSIPVGLASGLKAAGYDAEVTWGGAQGLIRDGILHQQYANVHPTADDVVLFANPNIIGSAIQASYPELSTPKRKIVFTSCDHSNKDFSSFGSILVEGPPEELQKKYGSKGIRVIPCLMGAPEDIAIGPTPYGKPTVFFCGRIAEWPPKHSINLTMMLKIAKQLEPDFAVAMMTNYITLPHGSGSPRVDNRVIIVSTVGSVPECSRLSASSGGAAQITLTSAEAVDEVNRAFGSLNVRNLVFHGARNWGTFWEWYRYAWCCLDFGFASMPYAPNTKVIDPLRAGGRIVASGISCSYHLIEKYGAGCIVPFQNVGAMVSAIRSLPPETDAQRSARSEAFRVGEGWNARMRFVADKLKSWL